MFRIVYVSVSGNETPRLRFKNNACSMMLLRRLEPKFSGESIFVFRISSRRISSFLVCNGARRHLGSRYDPDSLFKAFRCCCKFCVSFGLDGAQRLRQEGGPGWGRSSARFYMSSSFVGIQAPTLAHRSFLDICTPISLRSANN